MTTSTATTPPPFAGALRTAEELADVLDHVPSVVAYWDRDQHNRFANWAALDWLGKHPDELLGRHIRTALGARLYARNQARIERALAGEPQSFERTIVARQALIDYTPYAVDGEPAGFFTLVTDISAQAALEASRRQNGAQLALIAERERVAAGMEEAVIGRLGDAAARLDTSDAFSPPVRDLVAAAAQLVTASLSQLRAALHNPGPTGEPLSAAVRDVLDTATRGLGFAPTLTVNGTLQEITPVVGAEIVAMLIEALSNVARHAQASGAQVAIRVATGEVAVTVTDDGRGIERPERHSGLANMQSRAARFGGTCTWRDNHPSGTVVEWRAPVDRRSPRPATPLAPWQHRRATDPKPEPQPPALPVPDRRPASLALSAAQLVDVLDHIPAAVSVWDSALRNQFANRAAVDWLGGGDRAELLGRPLGELLPEDVYETNLPAARAALDGTPQLVERTASDGRHVRVSYTPRVIAGEVRGVYVQLIDVSARTEAEALLRDTNEQISVLRERQRIAEDLHDVVIQHLFAAGLKLDAARESGSDADLARIDAITAIVDGAIDDLRASIVSLRTTQPSSSSG